MNLHLTGKKAVVCGSTSGIGKAVAHTLANEGAELLLIARNAEKLTTTAEEIYSQYKVPVNTLAADFAQPSALQQALQQNSQLLAGATILVNNTGGPAPGQAHTDPVEKYLEAYKMHLACNQILLQALLPQMQAKHHGRVINIISTSVRQPIPNLGVSNTTRGAVAAWAKTISHELAPYGITVNNILPGLTTTPRLMAIAQNQAEAAGISTEAQLQKMAQSIPAGRLAQPEEPAALVAFLAGDTGAYISGQSIAVDGGKLACI